MPVFGIVPLGCTPPAFASNAVLLAVASWVAVVVSPLLLHGSPPVRPQISSFGRMARNLYGRI